MISAAHSRLAAQRAGPDLRGARPPTNRRPVTKPFIFYFSVMIDAGPDVLTEVMKHDCHV